MSQDKSIGPEASLVNGETSVEPSRAIARCIETGKNILVRWATDGLFYIGTVCRFSNKRTRVYVRYENGASGWCGQGDLQNSWMLPGPDIKCSLCQDGASKSPNEIVLCDVCGLGFHQNCHNPKVTASAVTTPDTEWLCRLCEAAKTEQPGNKTDKPKSSSMSDNNNTAESVMRVKTVRMFKADPSAPTVVGSIIKNSKQNRDPDEIITRLKHSGPKTSFPYDLNTLHWDELHVQNIRQIYCYCGGAGDWFWQMLQCNKCRQWFHQDCVSCLKHSLILGDRFYIFVCGVCNSGKECIRRLPLDWEDLTHLTLFYLTMKDHIKYMDLNEVLVPWFEKNWQRFQLPPEFDCPADQSKTEHIRSHFLACMEGNTSKFKNGREIKKKYSWWGLRNRFPPFPPPVVPLDSGPVDDTMMDEVLSRSRCLKRVRESDEGLQVPLRWYNNRAQTVPKKSTFKRKATDCDPSQPNAKKRRTTIGSKHTSDVAKVEDVRPEDEGATSSSTHPRISGVMESVSSATSHSPAKISLDHVIPCPSNFYGLNHPFKTILERAEEMKHDAMKRRILSSYSTCNGDADGVESASDSYTDSHMETESDTLSLTPSESNASEAVPNNNTKKKKIQRPISLLLRHLPKIKRKKRGRPSKAELQALEARMLAAEKMGIKDHSYIVQSCPSNGSGSTPKAEKRGRTKNVVDKGTLDSMSEKEVSMTQLQSSVNSYFGATNRIATGEGFKVLARRVTPDGKYQYLVEWEGGIVG